MDQKLRLVLLALQPGVDVRGLCAREGVAPSVLYAWRRRYLDGGTEALGARSRRPHRSPGRISATLEDEIVRLRKELSDKGFDAGPQTIAWYLEQDGLSAPSRATISRVLSRRGLIDPQPQKRPRSSWRRFEWPRPNDLWQGDMTLWSLAGGRGVEIIDFLDDHSRYVVALVAFGRTVTCDDTSTVFEEACRREGAPTRLVTDNGLIFTGNQLGFEVAFETRVRALGVHQISSSPYHPQTCGKLERFHQTLKKHLAALKPARTLVQLQAQLDGFRDCYNHQRPHQGIGRSTPADRYHAQPRSGPLAEVPDQSPRVLTLGVSFNGHLTLSPWRIGVGMRWAHTRVTVIQTGLHVQLYDPDNRLIREFDIDPNRRYQPTGQPPGRRPHR
jgi:transposase InsO family protein